MIVNVKMHANDPLSSLIKNCLYYFYPFCIEKLFQYQGIIKILYKGTIFHALVRKSFIKSNS